jgi:hypothetical protein
VQPGASFFDDVSKDFGLQPTVKRLVRPTIEV